MGNGDGEPVECGAALPDVSTLGQGNCLPDRQGGNSSRVKEKPGDLLRGLLTTPRRLSSLLFKTFLLSSFLSGQRRLMTGESPFFFVIPLPPSASLAWNLILIGLFLIFEEKQYSWVQNLSFDLTAHDRRQPPSCGSTRRFRFFNLILVWKYLYFGIWNEQYSIAKYLQPSNFLSAIVVAYHPLTPYLGHRVFRGGNPKNLALDLKIPHPQRALCSADRNWTNPPSV